MNEQTAADFVGNARIHIGLSVTDLARSKEFYEVLLGAGPVKVRPGYLKFEPVEPAVNLSLNLVDRREPQSNRGTHYGVQVKSTDAVKTAITRFREAGLDTVIEENTTCCYAVQDKVWVTDPDGNNWEVFVVLDGNAEQRKDQATNCCSPVGQTTDNCC